MRKDNTSVSLAGEYYVLAQLAQRGLVGTMTLSNTKGVDILVSNQSLDRLYKVEVKTTELKPSRERLFSETPAYGWVMGKKHETITDKNLFYCFVALENPNTRPKFFIVPSSHVSDYVYAQHRTWLDSRKKAVDPTTMRKFRIPIDDPKGFEDNWRVFSE